MAIIKGAREFKKWQEGKPLTRKEAMIAQCYICNGKEESAVDCQGSKSCPMYQYSLNRDKGIAEDSGKKRLPMPAGLKRYQERRNNQKTAV